VGEHVVQFPSRVRGFFVGQGLHPCRWLLPLQPAHPGWGNWGVAPVASNGRFAHARAPQWPRGFGWDLPGSPL